MKRLTVLLALLALALAPAAWAQEGGLTIEVRGVFLRSASLEAQWQAEFTDAEGNPATAESWVNLHLTAQIANGSSEAIALGWRLPQQFDMVRALNPEAMEAVPLGLGEQAETQLYFARDPDQPLPEGGLYLEYVAQRLEGEE